MHTTPSSHPRRARLWMAAALTALACSAQADEATIRKTLAERIPAFEALRLQRTWAGYYEMNLFDHNAIVGPHPACDNLIFANGFSGHGLQQSPAVGRGVAEWIAHGAYQTLDLSPLGWTRVLADEPLLERCVI